MSKAFQGTGAWPTNDAGKRMTRAQVEELERETPSTFYSTLETARFFVEGAESYQSAADEATDPEVKAFFGDLAEAHRTGDQVRAFKLWRDFGIELHEALTAPADEVRDE